jgi:hypothetical protein
MNPAGQQMVAYWTPKQGTDISDWEDGAAYSRASGAFAVTDGASTGANSREWAYLLARSFVVAGEERVFSPQGFPDWLAGVRAAFDPRAAEFPISQAPQWVRETGERQGAFATFLGGRLHDGRLQAIAVGDCCLFHLPAQGPPTSFPYDDPGQFGSAPMLVSSVPHREQALASSVRHLSIGVEPGDVIFAATDAIAQWLTRNLRRPAVWQLLARIGQVGLQDLCRDLRARGELTNDDVTLFRAIATDRVGAR